MIHFHVVFIILKVLNLVTPICTNDEIIEKPSNLACQLEVPDREPPSYLSVQTGERKIDVEFKKTEDFFGKKPRTNYGKSPRCHQENLSGTLPQNIQGVFYYWTHSKSSKCLRMAKSQPKN